jgi:cell division control protein 7
MTTAVAHERFDIHEDVRTEDTELMEEELDTKEAEPEAEEEEEEESSDEELVDRGVQSDMDKLQSDFPGFKDKYRLIKRIGEGTSPQPPPRAESI